VPKPRVDKIPPEVEARVLGLRSQGKLYREIKSELNVSSTTLMRILNPKAYEKRILYRRRRKAFWVTTIISGKKVNLRVNGRRPKPDECELCHKKVKGRGLGWHHWDDEKPELGLWLCWSCHRFVGSIEKGKHEKYLRLKDQATRGEL